MQLSLRFVNADAVLCT